MNSPRTILILVLLCAIVALGGIIFSSKKHSKEKTKTEKVENSFLKIPDYDKDEGIKTVASPPKPIDTGDVSYWFVVVQKNDGAMYNVMMQQNHKGFSMSEAKAEFKDKVFILNFIQVSKETWDINR